MPESRYLSNVRILIVDDNAFMRTVIRRILAAFGGNDVAEATDGAEALKILRTWPADLVLLDWEMMPLGGLEFTRTIRHAHDVNNTFLPIIMISAYSEFWRIKQARDAGVNEFLVKPISAKTLFSRIRNVIENPRPFVHAPGFFGPDRRRQEQKHGAERRTHEPEITKDIERVLEQDEIDDYFNENPGNAHSADPGTGRSDDAAGRLVGDTPSSNAK